jgi:hypothetical protein
MKANDKLGKGKGWARRLTWQVEIIMDMGTD